MAVKEIAAELGLSPKTVHVHRANPLVRNSNDVELAPMFDSAGNESLFLAAALGCRPAASSFPAAVSPVEHQLRPWSAPICGAAFPGLRFGLMLQCPRGYWPVLLGAEWLLILWLAKGKQSPSV